MWEGGGTVRNPTSFPVLPLTALIPDDPDYYRQTIHPSKGRLFDKFTAVVGVEIARGVAGDGDTVFAGAGAQRHVLPRGSQARVPYLSYSVRVWELKKNPVHAYDTPEANPGRRCKQNYCTVPHVYTSVHIYTL